MIKFTDAAKQKVLTFIEESGKSGMALRIEITERNAQGFKYDFQLEEYSAENENDQIIREGGFATRMSPETAKFMDSATVDWVTFENGGGFRVDNPNPPIPNDDPQALKESIIEAIKTIFDPEIPQVNIYDLGLIYDVLIDEEKHVTVKMTLTAPNCPAAEQLPADAQQRAASVPGVKSAKIDLTFEPPWNPDMMSEAAKLTLNLL